VLYEHEPDPQEVLEPNVAHVVTDVLGDVVTSGTATAADIGRPMAGKTGTTNDYRDAWFIGYTPSLTTSVWVGNRDNSVMDGISGGSLPAEIFSDYMSQLLEGTDAEQFPEGDTSDLRPLTGLEAPEPDEPEDTDPPAAEPDDDATEDDEDEDENEDDAAGNGNDNGNGGNGNGNGGGNGGGNGNGNGGNGNGNGNAVTDDVVVDVDDG
jgi:penicillin-binding protein 1A